MDADLKAAFDTHRNKVRMMQLDCAKALETNLNLLKQAFVAKVIVLRGNASCDIGTMAANLAIKFNMLYISVAQLVNE